MESIISAIVVVGFIVIMGTIIIYRKIYNSGDHQSIPTQPLDKNAAIIDIKTIPVGGKNDKVFRTTVTFSDGYKYIAHASQRKNNILTYTISLQKEDVAKILHKAIVEHARLAGSAPNVDVAMREILSKANKPVEAKTTQNPAPTKVEKQEEQRLTCPYCGNIQKATIKRCTKCSKPLTN